MPTYEFRLPDGTIIERSFKISEVPADIPNPDGEGTAVRIISGGAALVFKGSGFYLTDYGRNAHRTQGDAKPSGASSSEAGSKTESSGSGGESKASGGGESKSSGSGESKSSGSGESKSSGGGESKPSSGGESKATPAPKSESKPSSSGPAAS